MRKTWLALFLAAVVATAPVSGGLADESHGQQAVANRKSAGFHARCPSGVPAHVRKSPPCRSALPAAFGPPARWIAYFPPSFRTGLMYLKARAG